MYNDFLWARRRGSIPCTATDLPIRQQIAASSDYIPGTCSESSKETPERQDRHKPPSKSEVYSV